jgi:hypothetical protein
MDTMGAGRHRDVQAVIDDDTGASAADRVERLPDQREQRAAVEPRLADLQQADARLGRRARALEERRPRRTLQSPWRHQADDGTHAAILPEGSGRWMR